MNYFKIMPLTVLLYFSLKFLIKFIDENIIALQEKLELLKIEKGMISIKDLQKDNYVRFIKTVHLYLSTHGYENIELLPNGNSELTSFVGILNKEKIYISCTQNDMLGTLAKDEDKWNHTGRPESQRFLARMISNNCTKGIFINNSMFTIDAINFVENLNHSNNNCEIKLVDGYELTRAIRSYNNYNLKEDINYEF